MDEARMTAVVFYTKQHMIAGQVSLVPGARLTDFMREGADFVVVSDVIVSNLEGVILFKAEFIDLRRASIELAVPKDALK